VKEKSTHYCLSYRTDSPVITKQEKERLTTAKKVENEISVEKRIDHFDFRLDRFD